MIASRKKERLDIAAAEIRKWLQDTKSEARLEVVQCNIRKEDEVGYKKEMKK